MTTNTLEEYQYINIIKGIFKNGITKQDRTKTGTLSIFGTQSRYSLKDNEFPLLTTKKLFFRGIVEELLWFLNGGTNANELSDKGVNIWKANGTRAYLDSVGLTNREEGDLGPVYGFQWRHFGAKYTDMHQNYTGQGIDQIQDLIGRIKTNPNDRRMIVCSWNPMDVPLMALPPCHCLVQFYVEDNKKLSSILFQRSGDMGLGVPYNIASYALLTIIIAHVTELEPGEFIHTIGDAHVYLNHVEGLTGQIKREPRSFPKLTIKRNVKDFREFTYQDFELRYYKPHPAIALQMSV